MIPNVTPRPRGYRMCKAIETDKDGHHWSLVYRSWLEDLLNMWRENMYDDGKGTSPRVMVANALRDYCAQTVRLRKDRRALREQLRQTGDYLMLITEEVVRLREGNR